MTIKPESMENWKEDCLKWHNRVLTGEKSHWCYDWDGLPVDETTPEIDSCTCYSRVEKDHRAGSKEYYEGYCAGLDGKEITSLRHPEQYQSEPLSWIRWRQGYLWGQLQRKYFASNKSEEHRGLW